MLLPWIAVAFIIGAIIAGAAVWKLKPQEPQPIVRFENNLFEDQQFGNLQTARAVAISPNGSLLAYCTTKGFVCVSWTIGLSKSRRNRRSFISFFLPRRPMDRLLVAT